MFKRIFHFLILIVFVSACTPPVTTATPEIPPPDTPTPEQPTFTPTPEEPPKIEEEPLPVIPSERGHHSYNWQPEDVKGLDPWGDSTSDATDIVAIYQREMDGNFEFRLDIMNFEEDDELPPIYFAVDFLEGGSTLVDPESSLPFEIEWDLLASVVDGKFKLYDPAFSEITDQLVTSEINHQLDFVFFAISDTAFADWDGQAFQMQAMLLNTDNSKALDQTTPVATDSATGRAKLVVQIADIFYAYSPWQAADLYDGFRILTAPGREEERLGERRGGRYILDAAEKYEIPLSIDDQFIEKLPGGEYIRFNERLINLASKNLLDLPFTMGYGHFMIWQPDDVDAKAIEITREIRDKLDLPVSKVFNPYESFLTPGDIRVIKDAGFEAIYGHDQARYSFLGWIDEKHENQTTIKEKVESLRKIHQFNGIKFFFHSEYGNYYRGYVPDARWKGRYQDMYNWDEYDDAYAQFNGTDRGLLFWWRRILHDMAMDPDQEQFFTIGTDGGFTPWVFQEVVEWNFQWLASHPWIEVTTFSSILDRDWEVINHGNIDLPTDELLMRYQYKGDQDYKTYYPQHYYGGISDGHSPLIPAGVEIEAYYDYVPYLRDGELIPSGRIMGDDQTPGSIIDETLENLRHSPDNSLTEIAWLTYFLQIGEQTFHDFNEKLGHGEKVQANFLGQVNKIVEAALWAEDAKKGSLTGETVLLEKDLDLDGELEYAMYNDQVFAIFENDGGRLEYGFTFDPEIGPIQVISPHSQYLKKPGDEFEFTDGEVAISLGWFGLPDGAFVDDFDGDGHFDYEPMLVSANGEELTFTSQSFPVAKIFTLKGDTIEAHYQFTTGITYNIGLSSSINQLGVFEKNWPRDFEFVQNSDLLGWQMAIGGAVFLVPKKSFSIQTASFSDSQVREEMQRRVNESSYPPGYELCFPCNWIKIRNTQGTDFSLILRSVPIDKDTYVPLPTPTPIPTLSPGSLEAGSTVYDDALKGRWSLDPWGGTVDFNSSASVYEGSTAIEVALDPSGAITFDNGSFDVSAHDFLIFYLNGSATVDQQLYVEMKSKDNVPLGERAYLADYIEGYPLQPGQWHMVTVPLSLLNPDDKPFGWFDLGDASGSGASTFYIDEIRFVTAKP